MRRNILPTAVALTLLLPLAACSGNRRQPDTATAQLAFGTNMAQRGLWQEALFRFNEAERLDPQNFHVQNNLGVAYEAAGNFDLALKHYKRALEIAPTNKEAKANYARFVEFYQSFKPKEAKPGDKKAATGKSAPGTPEPGRGGTPATPGTSGTPRLPPRPGSNEPGAPGEPVLPPGSPQPPIAPPRGATPPPPDPGLPPPPPSVLP
jgi:hypothetical protein